MRKQPIQAVLYTSIIQVYPVQVILYILMLPVDQEVAMVIR